jgi:glycosyltransferase involved in cell wall biosynthesis
MQALDPPAEVQAVVLAGRWAAVRRAWGAAITASGAEAVFIPTELSFRMYSIPTVFALQSVLTSPSNLVGYPLGQQARYSIRRNLSRITARRAAHCIAVSEEARAVVIDTLAVPTDRVTVVYHGGPEVGPPRPAHPVKRLLVVSNIYRHKNLAVLMRALSSVTHPLELTVVGKSVDTKHKSELLALVREVPPRHQVSFVGPKYGEDLERQYDEADCLVWPSVAESFGFPLLEAYAHGLPILASATRSSREIVGDGAQYFDPHNPASLATALIKAATLGLSRGSLPRTYSWDLTSTRTAAVLRRVARSAEQPDRTQLRPTQQPEG